MSESDCEWGFCSAEIRKAAKKWSSIIKDKALYSEEDLVGEGWIVYLRCKKTFDPCLGVKFTTYLHNSLDRKFKQILDSTRRKKRDNDSISFVDEAFNGSSYFTCQERLLMVLQAIEALSEVSSDFACMITDEVPKGLFIKAKQNMRAKKLRSSAENSTVKLVFTKKMIEKFFGVSLKKLKALVYNYL